MREKTAKPVSFWLGIEEIEKLAEAAEALGITRNEAARRAIRQYAGLPEHRS